jgi:hypothetical protein
MHYLGDQKSLRGFGEVSLRLSSLISVSQDVLVKEIFCHARFRGSHFVQVGYMDFTWSLE